MSIRLILIGVAFAVLIVIAGVRFVVPSRPGPLEALEQRSVVEEYAMPFWREKRRTDPELWEAAKHVCLGRDVSEYPNCTPVLAFVASDSAAAAGRSRSPGIDPSLDWGARQQAAQERLDRLTTPAGQPPQGDEQP
jgi:hypothetical protein